MKPPQFLEIIDLVGSKEAQPLRTPSGIVWYNEKLFISDNGNRCIRQYDIKKNVLTTIFNREGEKITPYELDIDNCGILYFTDMNNHRIVSVDTNTRTFSIVSGGQKGHADGAMSSALFSSPRGLALDHKGNLFVCDGANNCIRKIDLKNGIVSTIAGFTRESGKADGPCSKAMFHIPSGVRIDSKGNLFITDTCNNCLRYINLATNTVSTLELDLRLPVGLNIWGNGLYICDKWNHRILFFDTITNEAAVLFENKTHSKEDLLERSSVLYCDFNKPSSVTLDLFGNLFIADRYNHIVRKAIRKKILPWACEKILWIGWMKNTAQSCNIAQLPKDLLKEVITHANKH